MESHKKFTAVLVLLVGVLFLLKDLEIWDFWQISGWTVVFLLVGVAMLVEHCGSCCKPNSKKKK